MRLPYRGYQATAFGIFTLLLLACGASDSGERAGSISGDAAPPKQGADGSAPGYTAMPVENGGTIRGRVRFVGQVPPSRSVAVSSDAQACGASQEVQTVSVGPDGGLAGAVVSLTDVARGAALSPAATPPVLDQRACRFEPKVQLVPVGATVTVLNSDPITHNVHTLTFDNRPMNRSQQRGTSIETSFSVAEKVKVKCDIHEWMTAWLIVIDHPYHGITDERGAFTIDDVPAGTHMLEAWHETLGAQTKSVTVQSGEVVDVVIELLAG